MNVLHQKLREIDDPETKALIDELALIAGLNVESFADSMLLHFIQQAYYPNGGGEKPVPIEVKDLDSRDERDAFILRKKIGKLGDQLHQICGALATMKGKSVEQFGGTALYVFLGKCVIEKHTRAKPRRWSDF
jgi:hypothetical protein